MNVRPTKRALALAGGVVALFLVGTNVQAGWVLVIAALLAGVLAVGAILPLRGLSGIVVGRRVDIFSDETIRRPWAGQRDDVALALERAGAAADERSKARDSDRAHGGRRQL